MAVKTPTTPAATQDQVQSGLEISLTLEASVGKPPPESFAQPVNTIMTGANIDKPRRELFNFIA